MNQGRNLRTSLLKEGDFMEFVIKAFDKDVNEIPYAIYDTDFTCSIPKGYTLKKKRIPKVARTSEDARRKSLVGEQDYNGKVVAIDKCKSLQK
jgi:hypothetical protein